MCYAREGYINRAEQWLQKAESLTHGSPRHKVIFFSNMACIYKQKGHADRAIGSLA
jgi:hypothetical protein